MIAFFVGGLIIGSNAGLEWASLVVGLFLAMQALLIGLTLGWLIWPYVTPFHALPRKCLRCGYDLRATGRMCPECGCVQSQYRLAKVPIPRATPGYKTGEGL